MNDEQLNNVNFTVDKDNLYREESITDIKVASIRKMTPIKPDGTDDDNRKAIFYGHSQLMSPQGPLPIQAKLESETLEAAMEEFPEAMKKALAEMVERVKKMQQEEQQNDSRIIMPGK